MPVAVVDTVFIRARRRDVHPLLADVARYGAWWPGMRSRAIGDDAVLLVRPPRPRWAPGYRVVIRITEERPDRGLRLRYLGRLDGEAEWYYLDEPNGVLVHHLLRSEAPTRRVTAHRMVVHAGLNRLKDGLEAGRPPGREPDPRLVADQRSASRVGR